jgi:hypothetical protein
MAAKSWSSAGHVWILRGGGTTRKLAVLTLIVIVACVIVWAVQNGSIQRRQTILVDEVKELTSSSSSLLQQQQQRRCSTTQLLCGVERELVGGKMLQIDTLKHEFHRMMAADKPSVCTKTRHFGETGDGGYDVCISPSAVHLTNSSCLVYSFGISNDWTFDEDMSHYGCEVHSFDPSIGLPDHIHPPNVNFHNIGLWGDDIVNAKNWTLKRLSSIRRLLGHEKRIIDVLKIDVEGAEWPFLRDVTSANDFASVDVSSSEVTELSTVRQLLFELHTPRFNPERLSADDLAEMIYYIRRLQDVGFRVYRNVQRNWCCTRFAPLMPANAIEKCCHETFYVNTRLSGSDWQHRR